MLISGLLFFVKCHCFPCSLQQFIFFFADLRSCFQIHANRTCRYQMTRDHILFQSQHLICFTLDSCRTTTPWLFPGRTLQISSFVHPSEALVIPNNVGAEVAGFASRYSTNFLSLRRRIEFSSRNSRRLTIWPALILA